MSSSTYARFRSEFSAALGELVVAIERRRMDPDATDLSETDKAAFVNEVQSKVPEVSKLSDQDAPWQHDVKRGIIDKGLEEMILGVVRCRRALVRQHTTDCLNTIQALQQPEVIPSGDSKPYDILADLLDIVLMFAERGTDPNSGILGQTTYFERMPQSYRILHCRWSASRRYSTFRRYRVARIYSHI